MQSLKDKDLYIGVTENIRNRLKQHNNGENSSTKSRIPFQIIYSEAFRNKQDAYDRERYLKTGWGRKHLRLTLKNTLLENLGP